MPSAQRGPFSYVETQDVWHESQQAIYDVLNSTEYRDIAPYVVHSIEFGSGPAEMVWAALILLMTWPTFELPE
jgi:hypothetical protein